MTLKAILDVIRESGAEKVKKIDEDAQQKVRSIRSEALAEAEHAKRESRDAAVAPAFKERAKIIHQARLDALQNFGNIRDSLVDAALEQTRGRLAGMRTDTAYPAVLHQLVREALAELAVSPPDRRLKLPDQVLLEGDPRDRELLETILEELGFELATRYVLRSWGGVIAKSADGKVSAINTLEARLERAIPYLRRYLASLFEDGDLETDFQGEADEAVAV